MKDPRQYAARRNAMPFRMFSRNGRWGTCVECPRDVSGEVYPEFCPHTGRYDHQLTLDDLVKSFDRDCVEGARRLALNGYIA